MYNLAKLLEDLDASIASDTIVDTSNTTVVDELEEAMQELQESLGLEDDVDAELDKLSESLEDDTMLEEANKIKFDKKTKLKSAISKKAILLGKEAGDGLYTRYSKALGIKNASEAALIKKYGVKAKVEVKAALAAK